jgi:Leu/Phe-tRNA-protein transferase
MPHYQCYVLTPDMHVALEKNLKAADDAEALQKCRLVVDKQGLCHAFELWNGDRRIGSNFDEAVQRSAT